MATMKELMLAGEPYLADDEEIRADYARCQRRLEAFTAGDDAARHTLLRAVLDEVGERVEVRPPFVCEFGRVRIGAGTFVNVGCVMLDCAPIAIGEACQLAPNVQLVTATHPLDPVARRAGWESAHPIVLEDNVWLGAGVIVGPGVRIGEDTRGRGGQRRAERSARRGARRRQPGPRPAATTVIGMKAARQLSAALPLPAGLREKLPTPTRQVAVVRLQGVITAQASPLSGGAINLHALEDALKDAFALPRLDAVALIINSPGGSPTQSALIADRIRQLADEKSVPVLAFCEDLAASGGYWLACAADEIIAHPTSLVGSIGVVSGGFGLDGLIARFDVERRLHTAGESKARLDPFQPEKAEDVEWLRGELEELHRLFVAWVQERRGDRLKDAGDVFTGEVWTGSRAHGLGLVDELGTLHGVIKARFPDAELTTVQAKKSLLAKLSGAAGVSLNAADAIPAAFDALERRAAWARFGR